MILASQSPRRRELLTAAGYEFEVQAPHDSVEKGVCSSCSPEQLVVDSAVAKASAIASQQHLASETSVASSTIVLAADTVAVCRSEILGKPVDEDHARAMLKLMSGKRHDVITGVCLWHCPSNLFVNHLERTTLVMSELSDTMLDAFIETDQWIGKAGAFGFQDGLDWVRIEQGLESNVVGLPIERLDGLVTQLLQRVAQG